MLRMLEEEGLGFQMNSIITQVQGGVGANKNDALADYHSFQASKNLMVSDRDRAILYRGC